MTELTLPSVHESVSAAVLAAEGVARAAGMSDGCLMRVSLAVSEAVANAIEHGNESVATKSVRVRIHKAGERLIVEVEDEGGGLDVDSFAAAELPSDPLDVGGRGLYLIRELAEQARIVASGAGAHVHMEFRERPECA